MMGWITNTKYTDKFALASGEDMEQIENKFEALFDLVQNQRQLADNDVEHICNNASQAYNLVLSKINIGERKHITGIDSIIKNVREKQLHSANVKLEKDKSVFQKYIKEFIAEEKRAEQHRDISGASRNEESSKKEVRQIDRLGRNQNGWTRNDVSELYIHLYQKNWTAAYEELKAGRISNVKDVCEELYGIMEKSYKITRNIVEETIKTMETSVETVVNPYGKEVKKEADSLGKSDETLSFLKIFLRRNVEQMESQITNKIKVVYPEEKWQAYPKTLEYISECTMITSLMMVQDPPMSISYLDVNNPIPADTYVAHGNTRGPRVAYRVFPALLAKTNGRVLVKGVIGRNYY